MHPVNRWTEDIPVLYEHIAQMVLQLPHVRRLQKAAQICVVRCCSCQATSAQTVPGIFDRRRQAGPPPATGWRRRSPAALPAGDALDGDHVVRRQGKSVQSRPCSRRLALGWLSRSRRPPRVPRKRGEKTVSGLARERAPPFTEATQHEQ